MKKLFCLSLMIIFATGCGESIETEAPSESSVDQKIRNGTTPTDPSGYLEAVGRFTTSAGSCTATIISKWAALTAAHCLKFPVDQTTFTSLDGRGTLRGTAYQHPRFNLDHWYYYDYAVIVFDKSIDDDPNFDSTGMIIPEVHDRPTSVEFDAAIIGNGPTGDCTTPSQGLSYAIVNMTRRHEDNEYELDDRGAGSLGVCKGDSGGPVMMKLGDEFKIVGVSSWFYAPLGQSFFKSTYMASRWIFEMSQREDLPRSSNRCEVYETDMYSPSQFANPGEIVRNLSTLDNRVSAIWVSKGSRLKGYSDVNLFGTQLVDVDGFNGEQCNKYGCWHELDRTEANNRMSSFRCDSDLPDDEPWANCILYDSYGNGQYNKMAQSQSSLPLWDNRAKHVWVRRGYDAVLYTGEKYTSINHINSQPLSGDIGTMCNELGCLHDLTHEYIYSEGFTSSIICEKRP